MGNITIYVNPICEDVIERNDVRIFGPARQQGIHDQINEGTSRCHQPLAAFLAGPAVESVQTALLAGAFSPALKLSQKKGVRSFAELMRISVPCGSICS